MGKKGDAKQPKKTRTIASSPASAGSLADTSGDGDGLRGETLRMIKELGISGAADTFGTSPPSEVNKNWE
ncbi:unnamed protein product, partial [Choristocarpus tenellus]